MGSSLWPLNYRFVTLQLSMKYLLVFLLSFSLLQAQAEKVIVNNRILTTVNGRTLSVLDVVKRMDVFLAQNYPQYLDSEPAKMQFYTMQWKATLQRMVDEELMMADAESREVKASDAEVREEIQNRYGPNVMASIDKLGLTYEEARAMVHQDLVIQKIQWLRVTSKALAKVTTDVVKKAFEESLVKNPPKEMWTYQFLTIRYDEADKALSLAEDLAHLEETASHLLPVAADLFKEKMPQEEWTHFSLSSELTSEDRELSETHRAVLSQMTPGTWSKPTVQQSRDGSNVVRIFHLKSHTKQETPQFETMATGLRQDLLNQHAEKEMEGYLARLHERFNYNQNSLDIPSQFQPFSF